MIARMSSTSVEILALGSENCLAKFRGLTVQWWNETRVEAVMEHQALFDRLYKQDPGPFAAMIVVEPSGPLPDAAARRKLDVLAASIMERCVCLAYVYQGTGFTAAAARGIMLAIMMTSGGKIPKKVCATVPEALAFTAPYLNEQRFGSLAERAQALSEIEARFASRPRLG
jgi:hypothetical protein